VLGPKVSGELVQAGVTSIVVALVLMLIYIWFRFEWQYSVGAVLALVHDVIITIGMFAVTQLEFNLSTIAAILTIVGYSMNDTVVVYDRIREKLRKFKKESLAEVLNRAINKTLSRTILTSVTTLVALISLWVLGGAALQGFAFAMIFGVVIGTYSSIFIAAPLLLVTQVKRESAES
jgi:preprotein translocase SecF subunit